MAATGTATARAAKATRRRALLAIGVVLLVGAIALDSKVVTIGSDEDLRQQVFDPDHFGQQSFPVIQSQLIERAPDAPTLALELATDKKAAVAKYGTKTGAFPVMPVSLTGIVGEGKSGIFSINVEGMPAGVLIRVQTGPAINGTELRDFPGNIEFGAFKNQIEFQDAGAGINRAMAAEVLVDLDRDTLPGKTIVVTGAFTMINPKNWLVTPVTFEVQ
jgi:predicted lipoprotein